MPNNRNDNNTNIKEYTPAQVKMWQKIARLLNKHTIEESALKVWEQRLIEQRKKIEEKKQNTKCLS